MDDATSVDESCQLEFSLQSGRKKSAKRLGLKAKVWANNKQVVEYAKSKPTLVETEGPRISAADKNFNYIALSKAYNFWLNRFEAAKEREARLTCFLEEIAELAVLEQVAISFLSFYDYSFSHYSFSQADE